MKAETPVLRGPRLAGTPGLANKLLQPMVVRCPPLCYGGGLGNRLLEARPSLRGPSTASSHPLHFPRPLHLQLPSALTPPAPPALHPGSGGILSNVEKTEPLERQDDKAMWDPDESSAHLPVYNLSGQDYEDLAKARGDREPEEFPDVQEPSASQDARLRAKKEALLNIVCCSLLSSPKFTDANDPTRQRLLQLCREIAEEDPEFILKVALYSRQELNIRSTSNFLLALGALLPPSRPHVRRYLPPALRLPSDWIQVARIYQSLAVSPRKLAPYPSCLRRGLSEAFRSFDEYQLAKYNTRKQRCKSNRRPPRRVGDRRSPDRGVGPTKPADPFTLKKLVQWLHLREPAHHIMCLLGRRYPSDLHSFSRSRLPGPWDSRRAGKRMKLPVPETWERELSLRGNTSAVWEQLIDHRKLPYMATLRNLRNMITVGIGPRHHQLLLSRIANKQSVIRSRQFPFRFLAAYKILAELRDRLEHKDDPLPTRLELMQQAVASIRQARGRSRFRSRPATSRDNALSLGSVSQQVTRKLKQLQQLRNVRYDQPLLERYAQALERAVEISAAHNVPPLPGTTVILCPVGPMMDQPCPGARDLHLPGPQNPDTDPQHAAPKLLEMAVLLALMVRHVSQHCRLLLCCGRSRREVDLPAGSVLAAVSRVLQEAKDLVAMEGGLSRPEDGLSFLTDCVRDHVQMDTLLLLAHSSEACDKARLYRYHVNRHLLFVQVDLSAQRVSVSPDDSNCKNDVFLFGYSDQILRFLCERGSCHLLDHVEKIDEIFNLPKTAEGGRALREMEPSDVPGVPQTPVIRWRTVRIFVSSTFRDVRGEREALASSVFPELRARAARHCVRVQEVDLRWGVTEEESRGNRALELCLSEVSRCQLFVLILGDRYGQMLPHYPLPDLPQFQWVKDYPKGRSITELELMQFVRQSSGDLKQTCFVYTRDPAVRRSIPEQWEREFCAESEEARLRMQELKREVQERDLLALENYCSDWGGLQDGFPHLGGLEEFACSALQHLWGAVLAQHCQGQHDWELDPERALDPDAVQSAFVESQRGQLVGRARQLADAGSAVLRQREGSVLLVHGRPSEGKTTFLAGLVAQLSRAEAPDRCRVLSHFSGAGEGAEDCAGFLRRLCGQLDPSGERPRGYRALVQLFHRLLVPPTSRPRHRLVVIVDGADRLLGPGGCPSSDWIPEPLHHGVTLVLGVTQDSPLHRTLSRRPRVQTFELGPLDPPDRSELVRRALAAYGKRLEETAFNNQLRLLVGKRGSNQPLYLRMATEELRCFGVFEKVSEKIRSLPSTLGQLMQSALGRLEQEYGAATVTSALCTLTVSERGVREGDLYSVLCASRGLRTGGAPLGWGEAMRETLAPTRPIAMATFARLLRSLTSVSGVMFGGSVPGCRLCVCGSLWEGAVRGRYLGEEERGRRAHLLLAAHLWRLSDPGGDGSFHNADPEALSDLPAHLLGAGLPRLLASLLVDLRFSWLHLCLGLLPQLGAAFASCASAIGEEAAEEDGEGGPQPQTGPFRAFVTSAGPLLCRHPQLFWQLALNQGGRSPIALQARSLLGLDSRTGPTPAGCRTGPTPAGSRTGPTPAGCRTGPTPAGSRTGPTPAGSRLGPTPAGFLLIEWLNKPQSNFGNPRRVMTVPSQPLCVAVCPGGGQVVVGTAEGGLHLIDLDRWQECGSVCVGGDGALSCTFVGRGLLCVASFDGKLETWDLGGRCRLLQIDAHHDRIPGCSASPDGKQLATCSWDRTVKVWTMPSLRLGVTLSAPCPLSCVAFHPQGQLLAAGGWDRAVRLWDTGSSNLVWCVGCEGGVEALLFSRDGCQLVLGGRGGDVRRCCVSTGAVAGGYGAHRGPVTALAFLAGDRRLLTAGNDRQVRVWSGSLGRSCGELGGRGKSPALCLSLEEGGQLVAVGYHNGTVRVFTLPTGELLRELGVCDVPVRCVQWLRGQVLVGGGEAAPLWLWDLQEGRARPLGRGRSVPTLALALSPLLLAAAAGDGAVDLWAACSPDGTCAPLLPVVTLRSHTGPVTCCCFSPDGNGLLTGSRDKTVMIWDVSDAVSPRARPGRGGHRDWVTGCSWGPRHAASCCNDGLVRLWDPESMECLRELTGHSSLTAICIVGEFIMSTTGSGILHVWAEAGTCVTNIPAHACSINHLVACQGKRRGEEDVSLVEGRGPRVLTAADDGTVRVWDPLQPEEVAALAGGAVRGVAAVNDLGTFLTVSDDRTLRLWDVPSGSGPGASPEHGSSVTTVCFSPSGSLQLSGDRSGQVLLWDAERMPLSVKTHELQVSSLTFLSDGEFVSTSFDGTVCVWSVRPRTGTRRLGTSLLHSIRLDSPVSALARLCDRRLLLAELTGRVSVWQPGSEAASAPRSSVKLGFVRFLGRVSGRVLGAERLMHPQLITLGELPEPGVREQERERESEPESEQKSEREQEDEKPERDSEQHSERDSEPDSEPDSERDSEPDSERHSEPESERDSERHSEPESERDSERDSESEPEAGGLDVRHIYRRLLPHGTPGSEEAWLTAAGVSGTSPDADSALMCGDSVGNLHVHPWDNDAMMWVHSDKTTHKLVHADRVSAVVATGDIIVTASHDQSVRLWDRRTLRQVGFFQCRAPVLSLALSPASWRELVCGDDLGHVYFLRLRPFPTLTPVAGGRGTPPTPSVTEPC